MTGNGHIVTVSAAAAAAARHSLTRVEKACKTSDLRDRPGRSDSGGAERRPNARRSHVSRSGTDDYAPLWHGPRLRPAFVAQVLGQVLAQPSGCDPRSVFAAYEDCARPAPRMAVDCKI